MTYSVTVTTTTQGACPFCHEWDVARVVARVTETVRTALAERYAVTEPLHPDDEPLIPEVGNDEVIEAPDDQHDPEEDHA